MLQIKPQHKSILVITASALALAIFLTGCGGSDDGGAAKPDPKKSASGGDPTGDDSATSPSSGGRMAGGGGGAPGPAGMQAMGGMPGGSQPQAAAATAPPKDKSPAPGFRSDPLKPWWDTTPKPPPVLAYVDPVRIAIPNSAAEEKPAGVEIQEVPNRRVAGILTGNGVYALLDDFGGSAEVVKPGEVLKDGYRVISINANSVLLKKVVDNRTYTQVVPLTDAGSTSQFSGGMRGPGMGAGGMAPGMGSGGRGGARRPGGLSGTDGGK